MIFLPEIISVFIPILKIRHFALFIYTLRFGKGKKHACKSRSFAYFSKYFFHMHCMCKYKNVFTFLSKIYIYIMHFFPIDNRDPNGC